MVASLLSLPILLSLLARAESTELLVVGTPPGQSPGPDGVAWLNIQNFQQITLCLRFKISQYFNLYEPVHPLIELSKANRIWSISNKCHRDNLQCNTGIVKRFKDSYKLGKTFGMFVFNNKFEEFSSWVPGQWNSVCVQMDKPGGYYGVFLNEEKVLEFSDFTTGYLSPVPIFNGRCLCAPLHGTMTDLNLWDSVLEEEKVVDWTRCGADQRGNVIHWSSGNLDTERKVITWDNSSLEISKLETDKLLLGRPSILESLKYSKQIMKLYHGYLIHFFSSRLRAFCRRHLFHTECSTEVFKNF